MLLPSGVSGARCAASIRYPAPLSEQSALGRASKEESPDPFRLNRKVGTLAHCGLAYASQQGRLAGDPQSNLPSAVHPTAEARQS